MAEVMARLHPIQSNAGCETASVTSIEASNGTQASNTLLQIADATYIWNKSSVMPACDGSSMKTALSAIQSSP
jgi:hypothetical protein